MQKEKYTHISSKYDVLSLMRIESKPIDPLILRKFVESVYKNMYAYNPKGKLSKFEMRINMSSGLIGEYGEIADAIKKILFHNNNKNFDINTLIMEVGDYLWYITAMLILSHENGEDDLIDNVCKNIVGYNKILNSLDLIQSMTLYGDLYNTNQFYIRLKIFILAINLDVKDLQLVYLFSSIFEVSMDDIMTSNINKLNERFSYKKTTSIPSDGKNSSIRALPVVMDRDSF